MPKKRLLASLAVAAGLGVGGVAGVILGVPAVSAAQTTTVPPTEDPATPATPDSPATPAAPDGTSPDGARPDRAGCPDKDGESDGSIAPGGATSGDAAIFRRGPGGGAAASQSL